MQERWISHGSVRLQLLESGSNYDVRRRDRERFQAALRTFLEAL